MGCGASSVSETQVSRRQSGRQAQPIEYQIGPDGRILSKPVVLPPSYRYGKAITQNELDRVRDEFWGTRVEGNAIMWQAIHSAADAILNKDLGLANAILEASSIVTPNASLELCYDERGQSYTVPSYCYSNPVDLLTGNSNNNSNNNSSNNGNSNNMTVKEPKSMKNSSSQKSSGTPIKVKVRVNPGDYNIVLDVLSGNTIAELKSLIHNYASESQGKMPVCDEPQQRIMFMGKELQNQQTMKQAGIDDVRIVQVFIRPKK